MVTLHSNRNQVAYGIQHLILDNFNDLHQLDKKQITPGSTIFIISTSKYYMLNGSKQWIEINPYGMGNISGPTNPSPPVNDNIYDGGSIDGSDPL